MFYVWLFVLTVMRNMLTVARRSVTTLAWNAALPPPDKKLYSIRDIVGTVESIPLITSSILSKKIAAGLKSLILDVKVGNGSFNATERIAIFSREYCHAAGWIAI